MGNQFGDDPSELITDPSFNDATKWTVIGEWSVAGGNAVYHRILGTGGRVRENFAITEGKIYRLTMEITILTIAGPVTAALWARIAPNFNPPGGTGSITTPGTKTFYLVGGTSPNHGIMIAQGTQLHECTIASVSLKDFSAIIFEDLGLIDAENTFYEAYILPDGKVMFTIGNKTDATNFTMIWDGTI